LFAAACLLSNFFQRRRALEFFRSASVPLQVYALSLLATYLLPDVIRLPSYSGLVSLITTRLTLLSAVVGCCLLGTLEPRRWHLAGFSVIAAAFFALTFQQPAVLNRTEAQAEKLVGTLPAGTRVLATIVPRPESRIYFVDHMVDRACIGHCFAYANYEP